MNFQKHAVKFAANENTNYGSFADFLEAISNVLPDHIILRQKDQFLIVKVNDEDDLQILDRCKRSAGIKDNEVNVSELEIDQLGKTPEYWDNITALSKVVQVSNALREAAKANNMEVEDLLPLVVNLTKRGTKRN